MYLLTQLMNVTVLVLLIGLIYIAVIDIKTKSVSVMTVVSLTAFGIINKALSMSSIISFSIDLLGIVIGTLVLLAISKITHEQIGYGDGLVYMMLSSIMTWQMALTSFIIAFILCGIFGLILITISRKRKGKTIPFVPFVTIAYMILIFVR